MWLPQRLAPGTPAALPCTLPLLSTAVPATLPAGQGGLAFCYGPFFPAHSKPVPLPDLSSRPGLNLSLWAPGESGTRSSHLSLVLAATSGWSQPGSALLPYNPASSPPTVRREHRRTLTTDSNLGTRPTRGRVTSQPLPLNTKQKWQTGNARLLKITLLLSNRTTVSKR